MGVRLRVSFRKLSRQHNIAPVAKSVYWYGLRFFGLLIMLDESDRICRELRVV